MPYCNMTDLNLTRKRVMIREDLNVPMKEGQITSDARIRAVLPTIEFALNAKAAVMIVSHLGRPTEGDYEEEFSLAPVAERLSELLKKPVRLVKDWVDGVDVKAGEVVLCENARFNVGEKTNNEELSQKMAALCDVYINDAFATAHRQEASTCGITKYAKKACAGLLMSAELKALGNVIQNPKKPVVAIIGGSKVSTKLSLLRAIAKKVDYLIVGGGIANTFIAAAGYPIGTSLYEPDLIDEAEELVAASEAIGVKIPLPGDVVVSQSLSPNAEADEQSISQVDDDEKILDIGPDTRKQYVAIIKRAKTVLWNGPVGAFEVEQFSHGTKDIAMAIAHSSAYSVAGGGDTIAAIEKYGIAEKISYISTGGGAFLSYLEGKTLPAVEALEAAYEKSIGKKG